MRLRLSRRLTSLSAYAFAEVDRAVERLRERGIRPIDFGVGDPTLPTPERIRRAAQRAIDARARSGYPSYVGSAEYRSAIAEWTRRRFGVTLDPATEICATIGAKEAVFHLPEALIDPGDVVLCPSPGYPPYSRGTRFAEGVPYFYPLSPLSGGAGFAPDLAAVPKDVLARARLLWVNHPNSPTGRVLSVNELRGLADFARAHDLVLACDEAYTEIYFGDPPASLLEVARESVIVFQSLSKRSAMTGWRVGWVAGDRAIVDAFKKLKTNIDSGTPTFVQDAAIEALADETHVAEMRAEYRKRRDVITEALAVAGLARTVPESTLYVWQPLPAGMKSVDFATRLLDPEIAIVVTPGLWLAEELLDGTNPGEGHVRFALVPSIEDTERAAERLARLRF